MPPSIVPDPVIVCVDCGGASHLLRPPRPDDPVEAGDIVAYVCADCGARWDVVYDADDTGPGPPAH